MQLTKPIIFFDLETTGLNIVKDRIVELSYIIVNPDGTEARDTMRFNPEMPIPPAVTAVHGISDEDVKNCPTFKQQAHEIAELFSDCCIAGYNSNHFDIPLLAEEFIRAGVDIDLKQNNTIDVQVIFFKKEPRNLKAAYRFYCNKDLEHAHSANADTEATYEVFKAQLERYNDLPDDIGRLSNYTTPKRCADFEGKFIFNTQNEIVIDFGKHKGKLLTEIFQKDPGYYGWIMNGEFPQSTKLMLTKQFKEFKTQQLKDKYNK